MLEFDGAGDFEPNLYGGRNFHFGVREHGMGAIANGLALSACVHSPAPSWCSATTCARRSGWRR
jgi:transketolase